MSATCIYMYKFWMAYWIACARALHVSCARVLQVFGEDDYFNLGLTLNWKPALWYGRHRFFDACCAGAELSERSGLIIVCVTVLCSWTRHFEFSQCLTPPRCINGYRQHRSFRKTWQNAQVTCNGLTSLPVETSNACLVVSCYGSRNKLRPSRVLTWA